MDVQISVSQYLLWGTLAGIAFRTILPWLELVIARKEKFSPTYLVNTIGGIIVGGLGGQYVIPEINLPGVPGWVLALFAFLLAYFGQNELTRWTGLARKANDIKEKVTSLTDEGKLKIGDLELNENQLRAVLKKVM